MLLPSNPFEVEADGFLTVHPRPLPTSPTASDRPTPDWRCNYYSDFHDTHGDRCVSSRCTEDAGHKGGHAVEHFFTARGFAKSDLYASAPVSDDGTPAYGVALLKRI